MNEAMSIGSIMSSSVNPFLPIKKEPLISFDGTESSRFAIQLEDEESNTGWKEVGDVSKSYFLISNSEMREVAEEVTMTSGMEFTRDKTFFNGKVFFETYTTSDIKANVDSTSAEVGDPLVAGLMFQNSYDGSRRASMYGFIKRLVCSNGMVSNFLFKNWKFKHTRSSENWQEEIGRATAILDYFPNSLEKFAKKCDQLVSTELEMHDLANIRSNRLVKLPDSAWGKIVDKFLDERQTDTGSFTQYDLLNACTSHYWHKNKLSVADFDWNSYCVNNLMNTVNLISNPTIPKA
jgi:hypothetical protein